MFICRFFTDKLHRIGVPVKTRTFVFERDSVMEKYNKVTNTEQNLNKIICNDSGQPVPFTDNNH